MYVYFVIKFAFAMSHSFILPFYQEKSEKLCMIRVDEFLPSCFAKYEGIPLKLTVFSN